MVSEKLSALLNEASLEHLFKPVKPNEAISQRADQMAVVDYFFKAQSGNGWTCKEPDISSLNVVNFRYLPYYIQQAIYRLKTFSLDDVFEDGKYSLQDFKTETPRAFKIEISPNDRLQHKILVNTEDYRYARYALRLIDII
jgi:hypothetical protein